MERRAKVNAVRDLAVRSGRMISMDPDRWGEHMLDSLELACRNSWLNCRKKCVTSTKTSTLRSTKNGSMRIADVSLR